MNRTTGPLCAALLRCIAPLICACVCCSNKAADARDPFAIAAAAGRGRCHSPVCTSSEDRKLTAFEQ